MEQFDKDRKKTEDVPVGPPADQVTKDGSVSETADGSQLGESSGLELNSALYKVDVDSNSSQPNNMAVAFELNL